MSAAVEPASVRPSDEFGPGSTVALNHTSRGGGELVGVAFSGLDSVPRQYVEIAERSPDHEIFGCWPWFTNLFANCSGIFGTVRVFAAVDRNGNPVALLPMCCPPRGGALKPRELSSLANYYTSLYSPILACEERVRPLALGTLVQAIKSEPSRYDVINLHPMDVNSAVYAELCDALKMAGMAVRRYFCFGNWYLKVNGRTYQEYSQQLPSFVHRNVERVKKQLVKSGRLRVEFVTQPDQIDPAIAAWESVYTSSWRKPEPYPQFMRGLIQLCADRGWLRMVTAYLDGEPAAAQVWIVRGNVASIYKIAYDERFSKHSLGSYLSTRLMEHVIDIDRVSEVDYLTGDDEYKKQWMSDRRERWGILAFNKKTPLGLLGIARHIIAPKVRDMIAPQIAKLFPARRGSE